MKRQCDSSSVEFSIGPHTSRRGWEVVRITYNPGEPDHRRQVGAALTALAQARSAATGDDTARTPGGAQR